MLPFFSENYSTVFCGDNRVVMAGLPEASVDMCMTSPPYYGLRAYKCEPVIWGGATECKHEWNEKSVVYARGESNTGGQPGVGAKRIPLADTQTQAFCLHCGAWRGVLGIEPTPQLYIQHLVSVFEQVRRVLKPEGTIWVNISDSYNGRGHEGVPAKSLIGIPARFQLAMIDAGWICRNDIIWWKRSCMPESVSDRFTRDFEHIFMFSASNKTAWWSNEKTMATVTKQPLGTHGVEGEDWERADCPRCQEAVNPVHLYLRSTERSRRSQSECKHGEPGCKRCKGTGKVKKSFWGGRDYYFEQQFEATQGAPPWGDKVTDKYTAIKGNNTNSIHSPRALKDRIEDKQKGRNKRTVWDVTSGGGTKFEHYASYPVKLCETPISAGCPEYICPVCGQAREKVYNSIPARSKECPKTQEAHEARGGIGTPVGTVGKSGSGRIEGETTFIGYSDCLCSPTTPLEQCVPGVVLDPFAGTGTTGYAAKLQGKKSILIDVSPEYCAMTVKRLNSLPASRRI